MRRQDELDLLSASQENVLQSNNEKLIEQASKYLNEIGLNDSESWDTSVTASKSAGGETSSVAPSTSRKSLNAISEDGSDYFTDDDSLVAMARRMNAAGDLDSVVSSDATICMDNRGHAFGTKARSALPSISEIKKMAKIFEEQPSAPPPPKYRPAAPQPRPSSSHPRGKKNRALPGEGESMAPENLSCIRTETSAARRESARRRSYDGPTSSSEAHWDADETRRYRNRSRENGTSASPPRNVPRNLGSNHESEVERRRGSIKGKKTLKLRNRKKSVDSDDEEPMQGIGFNTRLPDGERSGERRGSQTKSRSRSRSQSRNKGRRDDRTKSERRSSIPQRIDGTRRVDPPPAFPTPLRPNRSSSHHTNGDADDNSVYDSDDQTEIFYESTDDEFDSDDEPTLSVSEAVAEMNRHSLKGLFGRFK